MERFLTRVVPATLTAAVIATAAPSSTASEPPATVPVSGVAPSGPPMEHPPAGDHASEPEAEFSFFSHGFRLGYLFMLNHDCAFQGAKEPDSGCVDVTDKYHVKSPHFFLIGYELTQRVRGSSWLNVIFVENVLLGGLEQSLFLPSFNAVLGFELYNQLQVGVGANVLPVEDKPAHMLVALGWVPRVGNINVPIHFAFIPDVDKQHRFAATTGVNW
jgi:hypothetical protein